MLVQRTGVVSQATWDMLAIWSSMDIKTWVIDNIHGPGNAIPLSIQFRMNFHAFRVWLEKVSDLGGMSIVALIVRPGCTIGHGYRRTEYV